MQPRHAAFTMLRRLALQGIRTAPRNLQKWNSPAMRLLHYHPTRKLLSSKLDAQKTLDAPVKATEETETIAPVNPYFLLTFTCKPCNTRSTHKVTRVGYHYGSVLITCPECKNRHIISDHLKIFSDKSLTVEDLMREQGQLVKRGTLSEDGNLEFWANNPPKKNVWPRSDAKEGVA